MSDGYGRLWRTRWTKNSQERKARVQLLRQQADENPDEFDLELYVSHPHIRVVLAGARVQRV